MPKAITKGKISIGAYLFPDRKKPSLCIEQGAGIMTAREKTSADLSKKKLDYDEITQKLKAITSTIPTISSGD